MLTLKAFEQPQGNLVSGRYVAPSWTQQLAPLVSGIAGQAMNEKLDKKQLALAEALREKNAQDIQTYAQLQQTDPAKAIQFGLSSQNPTLKALVAEDLKTQKYGEGEIGTRRNIATGEIETIGKGAEKFRAPTSVDMGTLGTMLIYPDGRREMIQKGREGPAGQVVETANGPMLVNTRTGAAQPIMGAGNQPLAPKLSAEQSKDITSINQQRAAVTGALQLVEATPSAFSFGRGLAGKLPAGETLAGRTEKPEQTEARSAVFNIVSKVINERAGAAQSAQELARLNAFLPSELDNAESIKRKLNGFNKYLNEQEKGTRVNPNIPMQSEMPQALRATAPQASQIPQFDPKLLQYMTPEQQALFAPKR
jgi:hypothetical protein